MCSYLHTSNHDAQLVEFHYRLRQQIDKEADDHAWAHLLANPHASTCLSIIAASLSSDNRDSFLEQMEQRKTSLAKHIERIIAKKPLLSAGDLMKEGIQPGKGMGFLMKEAEKLAIRHDATDSSAVLALLKKSPIWHENITETIL